MNEEKHEMTENGPIESYNAGAALMCPCCLEKGKRLHTEEELKLYHPNRVGVDDRYIQRK